MNECVHRTLARVPPFTNIWVRERLVRTVRRARWWRAAVFERFGVRRYSRPALSGIDTRLAELLGAGGVFVEAGANDGYRQSNTYYLERWHGWTGVLIEPIPELHRLCAFRRRSAAFNCALVETPRDRVTLTYSDLGSHLGAPGGEASWGWERPYEVSVPGRTLSSVLDEAGVDTIDLLSLDLEGHEVSALRGLDLDRHAPRYLLVESHEHDADKFDLVLRGRYVLDRWLTPRDALFRRA
jgi:FkbM family methyltransferase